MFIVVLLTAVGFLVTTPLLCSFHSNYFCSLCLYVVDITNFVPFAMAAGQTTHLVGGKVNRTLSLDDSASF